VLFGLTFRGDTSLEFSWSRRDHKDGNISLSSTSDHILDEVSVSWGINDGDVVLLGLKLVEGDVDGNTSGSLSFEFIENPSIGEGSLTHGFSFLLIFLKSSLVETSALDDEVTSRGGLSGVDVTNNDEVNLLFLIRHL
jgi:hypothetical protein